MRTVTRQGRWVWGLSGLVTLAVIVIPGTQLITGTGGPGGMVADQMQAVPQRVLTIVRPVTSIDVESYGAQVSVFTAAVPDVRIAESITYGAQLSTPPRVTHSVSGGLLTLAAPECAVSNCSVGFAITVPRGVSVTATSDGGPVTLSGVTAATVDSGGGWVNAARISGPLTINAQGGNIAVSKVDATNIDSGGGDVNATDVTGPLSVNTEGGALTLNGLTGPLDADTSGGPLTGLDVAAVTATVNTEGGNVGIGFTTAPQAVTVDSGGANAQLDFAAPPQNVTVNTEGGNAIVGVPGGPYAVTADSGGGPQSVGIATDPAARRSITVSSDGGSLQIGPAPLLPASNGKPGSSQPAPPVKPARPTGPKPNSA